MDLSLACVREKPSGKEGRRLEEKPHAKTQRFGRRRECREISAWLRAFGYSLRNVREALG
jgi:hypothetical protein